MTGGNWSDWVSGCLLENKRVLIDSFIDDLIEANESTRAGRIMQSQEWGEATSIPPRVNGEVCTIPLRNGLIAVNSSDLAEAAGFGLDDDFHLLNESSFEAFEK